MRRLSEDIADEIKFKILNGTYQKGEKLKAELDMAKDHDVSRSVIRESLRQLEGLGLVTIKKGPKGGIFVSTGYHKPISDSLKGLVDAGQVSEDNIFDTRLLLETYATAQAALHADDDDIQRLRSLLRVPEKHFGDAVWLQKNRGEFHLALAKASKNPVLEVLMKGMIELLRKYFVDFHDLDFERKSLESHKQILTALEEKNSNGAGRLMERYILNMRDVIAEKY
ncbi:MAG: FadR family transcriptional regulator [Desulfobacteraceae bacterium]|nr:MAG: FadR family transcriptional regulator [Desulfobacteraceae bacterium]